MRDTTTRVLLIIVGIGNAVVGLWAAVAPQSFYDDFPGAGRHWVAVDGPYNEHLVRDVGVLTSRWRRSSSLYCSVQSATS